MNLHAIDWVILALPVLIVGVVSGLGSAIIGGFYWKKGTNAGAWSSMIVGSSMALGGFVIQQVWVDMVPWLMKTIEHPGIQAYLANHAAKFPLNGQVIGFYAMLASVLTYVIVSLLTCKEDFNMDQMLHRGKYAIEAKPGEGHSPTSKTKWNWTAIMGFDREFTVGDKWISGSMFVWSMFWFVVFLAGTTWYLIRPWPLETWGKYWYFTGILLPLVIGAVTTVWFTIGGIRGLIRLFHSLNATRRNERDDGMVVNHHNLDELPLGSKDTPAHGL